MTWREDEKRQREYQKQYHAKRYAEKREEILARNKKWRDENPDKQKAFIYAWRENNKERNNENNKRWRDNNPEAYRESKRKCNEKNRDKYRETDRAWREANRDHVRDRSRKYLSERLSSDPQFKIAWYTRIRMRNVLKGIRKSAPTLKLLGCTLDEARAHIEAQFKPGMTWDNWSDDGWHLDHILPLAGFDLTDSAQQAKAFHYTNLQPLWALENLQKGARIL